MGENNEDSTAQPTVEAWNEATMPNNDGYPTSSADWKLIGSVFAIFAVMVAALWTIVTNENANNAKIDDNVKTNYVTKASHQDLVDRIGRVQSELNQIHETSVPRAEFDTWIKERTRNIDSMQRQLDGMTSRVEQVVRDRASVESLSAIQKQIDQLSKHIDDIAAREDLRHIKVDGNK